MNRIATPIQLSHLQPKNRLIRSAVHSFLADKNGFMTEAEYSLYETLAESGIGTVITGHCCVAEGGRANDDQINIYDDRFIPQFTEAAKRVHAHSALFIAQINHAGPRAINTDDPADVSPSILKKGHRQTRAMTLDEIHAAEQAFIDAALRLQKAGVDGIQVHAAHSYLISRFLDPFFNVRTDEYGGTRENRFRMLETVIRGIKEACGTDFPVLVKVNADTKAEDTASYHEDMIALLQRMHELGVELVEFSGADFIHQPRGSKLYYLDLVRDIKAHVPEEPVSLVGGVRSREDMETVLDAGIDMVSLGRPLIADPAFAAKALASDEPSICISCSRCFALPHLHPGIRCIWAWKEEKARQKQEK